MLRVILNREVSVAHRKCCDVILLLLRYGCLRYCIDGATCIYIYIYIDPIRGHGFNCDFVETGSLPLKDDLEFKCIL